MKPTVATLFAGCGGATLGAIAAGYRPIWAVEYDSEISQLYRKNIGYCLTNDVNLVNYDELERPNLLLVSPPCCNFSGNNTGGKESDGDRVLARSILRAIRQLDPDHIVIENVAAYRNSASFGYLHCYLKNFFHHDPLNTKVLCATRFGVPQTRKRYITRFSNRPFSPVVPTWQKSDPCGWRDGGIVGDLVATRLTAAQEISLQKAGNPHTCLIQRLGYRGTPKLWLPGVPIGTISAHGCDDGKGHSRESLTLLLDNVPYKVSTELAASLSGLPENYEWSGNKRVDMRAIGNIFHPPVAEAVVQTLNLV